MFLLHGCYYLWPPPIEDDDAAIPVRVNGTYCDLLLEGDSGENHVILLCDHIVISMPIHV